MADSPGLVGAEWGARFATEAKRPDDASEGQSINNRSVITLMPRPFKICMMT
jgi:hypothetical protein